MAARVDDAIHIQIEIVIFDAIGVRLGPIDWDLHPIDLDRLLLRQD
jgi:hypothetical protein